MKKTSPTGFHNRLVFNSLAICRSKRPDIHTDRYRRLCWFYDKKGHCGPFSFILLHNLILAHTGINKLVKLKGHVFFILGSTEVTSNPEQTFIFVSFFSSFYTSPNPYLNTNIVCLIAKLSLRGNRSLCRRKQKRGSRSLHVFFPPRLHNRRSRSGVQIWVGRFPNTES